MITDYLLPRVSPIGLNWYLSDHGLLYSGLKQVFVIMTSFLLSIYLLGGSGGAIFTGIGMFSFLGGASGNNLTGMGMVSGLGGGFGKSLLDLPGGSFLGITLAGDSDWRLNLLGESDLVLDLQCGSKWITPLNQKLWFLFVYIGYTTYLSGSGALDETEEALDRAKGVPIASLCLALV